MALAPADFYAYSRATGTPVPEDPEERAQLAPRVAEFRRNQLRAPQQESPLPGILGATAVGLGALTGGMALARALRGNKGQAAASTAYNIPRKVEQDIRTVSTPVRQRVAEDVVRQARTERPTGTVLTDLVDYRFQQGLADIPEPTKQELANVTKNQFNRLYNEATKLPLPRTTVDPNSGRSIVLDPFGIDPASRQAVYAATAAKPESELPRVYRPQTNIEVDLITDPNTGEIFRRGKSPESFAQTYISLRPALTGQKTDLPITRTPGSFLDFSKTASGEAAAQNLLNDPELKQLVAQQRRQEGDELGREAQRQMRIASAIESEADQYIAQLRQESLSQQTLSALESGEDQMTGRTMRSVQRNEDLDVSQVNQVARQTGSADVAASMTPDGVPVDQTDPINKAQSFLEQKRLELSSSFSPARTERILSASPDIAEAAELYAATGDPQILSRFSQTPSTPLTVKPTVQMSINDPELPTSQFFKATGIPEYTGNLLAEDIELTNQISSLGAQQQALARKAQELGEQELMLRVAMDRDPASGGEYTKMFAKVKNQQQNLPDPASLNVDLGDALAERDYVRGRIQSLQNLGSTYKLTDVQEGVRPYYEYDELGQVIPSTLELRGGRKAVDLGPKTGGGRLVAEYDPAGQTGSTKGIYGIEQTSRRVGEATRPTQMTMRELVREGMEQASASPEGDVPIPPSLEQMTERVPTTAAKRSLQASEIVRRAIIEGRDPQMILRQRGFSV